MASVPDFLSNFTSRRNSSGRRWAQEAPFGGLGGLGVSNSHYGRFDPRRAVLGLTASLRLLTGYLTGWNSKTTHVYAPPYGFTPPTPPKRQQFSFWGRCRINALFRQVWGRRIYAAARRQSENCRAPKAKMRIAEGIGGMKASKSWSDQVIGTRAERRMQLFLSTNRRDYAG